MTQEEKQLLLIDLCARLPYGIKCYEADVEYTFDIIGTTTNNKEFIFSDGYERNLEQIKPYLRPMSSMTKEEVFEYLSACSKDNRDTLIAPKCFGLDYLLSHHLDVRGLIPMGLALEAKEGMYKNE